MYHLQRINNRTIFTICAFVFILFVITIRLFYLQIIRQDHYIVRGKKNFTRIESQQSMRGNIIDCYGKLIATNRPVTSVIWQGTGNHALSEAQKNTLAHIEIITNKEILNNPQYISQIAQTEKLYKQLLIAPDIPFEQLGQIEEQFPAHPNILIHTNFKRHYPYRTCASHVLGYLGKQLETELYGKMGLEKLCEEYLRGEPGTIVKTINSVGRHISTTTLKKAQSGQDIKVTIDLDLQQVCELIFPSYYSGTMIVLDPETGALCALVSRPDFDPSLFLSPISEQTWNSMQEKKPFINRAINPYPPGSIFKLVSISAALETGILKPDSSWYCRGYTTFAQRRYWCHQRWGHGHLNISQAVAHSCNTLFYEIGRKIDIDVLAQYAHKFGLGLPTGIIFPEHTGIVPSRAWKREVKGESWWPGETLSAAIGQSFLMTTPLQIARMVGSIFTGYLITPRILVDQEIEKKLLPIARETRELLKQSMRFVVTQGTGRQVSTVKDIKIYAKTSTAQTSDFEKRDLGTKYLEHAWFVAYFQYKEESPLIFIILIENAGTSQIPTVIAKQFLIEYKNLINSRIIALNAHPTTIFPAEPIPAVSLLPPPEAKTID